MRLDSLRRVAFAVSALALVSCGDDFFPTFTLRLRAESLADGANSEVVAGAVDLIDVVIDPANNVDFDVFEYAPGVDHNVRRTAAGEYQLSLLLEYIEANRVSTDTSWYVDVPLYIDGLQGEPVTTTRLTVLFSRSGDAGREIIAEARRDFPWPPESGDLTAITVFCLDGYDMQCQTPTP